MDRYALWDFITKRGDNEILSWVVRQRLTVRDRAMLNNKLRRLAQLEFDLSIKTKLLAGPIHKHIYKLVIHGDVMLRPMLCRGPIANDDEYTLLVGAIETGNKLPTGAKEQADENRRVVLNDQSRRCRHVSIP